MCEDFALPKSISDIKKESSVQIWGVGNLLLGDDAVGGIIASRLGGTDCGVAPENYISKLRNNPPEILFLIDATDFGAKPGAVKIFEFHEMSGAAFTSHGVPLKMLLEPFSEKIKIYLVGIQPKNLELGEPLSSEVAQAAEAIVSKLVHHSKFSPR